MKRNWKRWLPQASDTVIKTRRLLEAYSHTTYTVVCDEGETDTISIRIEKIGDVWFGVAFDGQSVYAATFTSNEKEAVEALKRSIPFRIPLEHKKTEFAEHVIAVIKDIYDGKETTANFTLSTKHLPKYTKKVIETVCKVPTGYVTSYGEVAKAIGGGPRAVGQIMAKNPFPPICPCHRVVSSDFTLGGYGGGLAAKLRFLKRERRGYMSERQIPINGKKLRVFPVERVISKVEKR